MKSLRKPSLADCLLGGYLLAVTLGFSNLSQGERALIGLGSLGSLSLFWTAFVTLAASGGLWLLGRKGKRSNILLWTPAVVFGIYAVLGLTASFSWGFLAGCGILLAALTAFAWKGRNTAPEPIDEGRGEKHRLSSWITGLFALAFTLFLAAWSVGRFLSFSAPTYDFGIFSQMFYYMEKTGLPLTTLEREGLLSHFAVHVSPVYYLMLPIYCLFPNPATLQMLQAVVMTSSVIPLWKIGKRYGLSDAQRMLLCTLFLLQPAFAGGVGYDLHENCFLSPLLLWLLYGIAARKRWLLWLACVLTLSVKEDAAVYAAVVGLWLTAEALLNKNRRKDLADGLGILTVSVVWFLAVTHYLSTQGDGVMTYRYNNFLYDSSGSLLTVVKAVLLHPLKAVYECMDKEKLSYIAMTLLPLLGLPLLTRRFQRYILLIPYILVNLMPDYTYQHNLFFQYNFGAQALLIYLAAVNLSDMKREKARMGVVLAMAAVTIFCFWKTVWPTAVTYPRLYGQYRESYDARREVLANIPEEASVTASTFYTAHLSRRKELYDTGYVSREQMLSSDYIILDVVWEKKKQKDFPAYIELLEQKGYRIEAELPGVLLVYRK